MRKVPIIAKVILNDEQLKHKLELGCDGMELQLYEELYAGEGTSNVKPWGSVVNIHQLSKYPIVSVHMPLRKQGLDVMLEYLLNPLMQRQFENVCSLANAIGHNRQCSILVVLHSEANHGTLLSMGILEPIALYIRDILRRYPNIEIGIENLMPIFSMGESGYTLSNDCGFSSISIAKYLRTKLGTHRVGTVLDTCHAVSASRTIVAIEKMLDGDQTRGSLDILFGLMNSSDNVCKEIHLANAYGFGIKKESHGTPFVTAEDEALLHNILDLYKVNKMKCPICIEIQEKDYTNCVSYAATKKQIENYFKTASPAEPVNESVLK